MEICTAGQQLLLFTAVCALAVDQHAVWQQQMFGNSCSFD
jgi:hypothetical protein